MSERSTRPYRMAPLVTIDLDMSQPDPEPEPSAPEPILKQGAGFSRQVIVVTLIGVALLAGVLIGRFLLP